MVHNRLKQLGQGMTEYIIIVALIAIAAIAVYSLFGNTIKSQVAGMSKELSGQDGGTAVTDSQTSANDAATKAKAATGLGNYTGQN